MCTLRALAQSHEYELRRSAVKGLLLMSDALSAINVIMVPLGTGDAIHVAVENFSIAFGAPTTAGVIATLLSERDRIERSLTDNAERPSAQQLDTYGGSIASALLSGDIFNMYTSVGAGRMR